MRERTYLISEEETKNIFKLGYLKEKKVLSGLKILHVLVTFSPCSYMQFTMKSYVARLK